MTNDPSMIRDSELTIGEKLRRSIDRIGWTTVLIAIWIVSASVFVVSQSTSEWVLKADYIDACSCDLACP